MTPKKDEKVHKINKKVVALMVKHHQTTSWNLVQSHEE